MRHKDGIFNERPDLLRDRERWLHVSMKGVVGSKFDEFVGAGPADTGERVLLRPSVTRRRARCHRPYPGVPRQQKKYLLEGRVG